MTIVDPDDIPTSITKTIHTMPGILPRSESDLAAILAHCWPSIREHFAQRIQEQNPDRDADFSAGVDWATDLIRES